VFFAFFEFGDNDSCSMTLEFKMYRDSYGKRTEMSLQQALSRLKGHFTEHFPTHTLTFSDICLVDASERSHATNSLAYMTCLTAFSRLHVQVPRGNNIVCCKMN